MTASKPIMSKVKFYASVCVSLTASIVSAQTNRVKLEELSKPRLELPITLRYKVVETDIRPAAAKRQQWNETTERQAARMAKQGESKERIDEFREARRRAPLDNTTIASYTLTISLTQDSLVYRRAEETANKRPLELIDTVGHDRSYRYRNYALQSYNGNYEVLMDRIPFPGLGLGPYPIFKLDVKASELRRTGNDPNLPWADVVSYDSSKGPITYEWGTVYGEKVDGKPRITRIAEGFPDKPHDDWRFSDYKMQNGLWVANHLEDRSINMGARYRSTTYNLLSLEHTAGVSAEDTIRKTIEKGDPVQELDAKGKLLREYLYDPEKGDPFGAAPGMASAMLMSLGGVGALVLLTVRLGRRRR